MKKLILTLVFVFAMGTMINANENKEIINSELVTIVSMDCYDFAEGIEDLHGGGYQQFADAYDWCEWLEGRNAAPGQH